MSDSYFVETAPVCAVQTGAGTGPISGSELMVFEDGRMERMGFFEMVCAMESGECVMVLP